MEKGRRKRNKKKNEKTRIKRERSVARDLTPLHIYVMI